MDTHEKFYKYTNVANSSFTKDNSKGSGWTVQHEDWRLQFSQEFLQDYFHGNKTGESRIDAFLCFSEQIIGRRDTILLETDSNELLSSVFLE